MHARFEHVCRVCVAKVVQANPLDSRRLHCLVKELCDAVRLPRRAVLAGEDVPFADPCSDPHLIEPGSPWENGYIESFNKQAQR